jgi:prepilin-type processing-associated H-X9-DG protein
MSEEHANRYTLRDLIFGTLAIGLMCASIPSCMQARGGSRFTCLNNQHQLGLALTCFDANRGYFSGYANNVAGRTTSFIVPLLPLMERNDIYSLWAQPGGTETPANTLIYMSMLVCPSNPPQNQSGTPTSYVINAGQADPAADAAPELLQAGGIAFDLTAIDPIKVGNKYVAAHDGTTCTLLLSESLDAGSWALTDKRALYSGTTSLWWNQPPNGTSDYKINGDRIGPNSVHRYVYCRPSSKHPGGVNILFCDGHSRFLADDIDYKVYKQFMTPDGAASGDTENAPLPSDYLSSWFLDRRG